MRVKDMAMFGMIGICLLLCLTLLFWIAIPTQVLVIKRFATEDSTLHSGDEIVYEIDYCKNQRYNTMRGSIQYSISGTKAVSGTPVEFIVPGPASVPLLGGCGTAVEIMAPPPLPPGKYHLEMIRTYEVNPVKKVVVEARSNEFEIVPSVVQENMGPRLDSLLKQNKELIDAISTMLKKESEMIKEHRKAVGK